MQRGEIKLKNETLAVLDHYPLSRGIPLPPGAVTDPADVSITDDVGNPLPSAGRVLQRRPDNSIEWLGMDILVPIGPQQEKSIFIETKPAKAPPVDHAVEISEAADRVTLSNALTAVTVNRAGGSIIETLSLNGRDLIDESHHVDLEVLDGGGKIHRASLSGPYKITTTHDNPLRKQITIEGAHTARDGSTFLNFALRLSLTANCPDLTFEHTFYCYEDREGKIPVRAMRLVMPTAMDAASTKRLRQSHHGHTWLHRDVEVAENVEVVASSVGDVDNYAAGFQGAEATHPCAGGSVFLRNMDSLHEDWSEYPFHMRPGQASGFRAQHNIGGMRMVNPILGWHDPAADYTLVTTFEHFRQLHPKSIYIDDSLITYNLWPEWSIPMQIVQGVSKSHIWYITGEPKSLNADDCIDIHHRWEYGYVEPVDVSFDPDWPRFCEVLDCHRLLKFQPDKYPALENLIEPVPSAGNPHRHTYDRLPAIGMFHFGDQVEPDAASCNNNEDDTSVYFPLEHFLRTGHTYAWDYGKETARHYMEVDFCEWSTDPRQHGGLIPHTGHHFIGNVYPSHQWAEGILAYYYMSGDERARKAVIACGDNNVYWANDVLEAVVLDGREAGMPLINLAAAYRLTRDRKYLDAADRIIEGFFDRWIETYGEFKYPYPQGTSDHPHKLITGYGDWSSFTGLYRLWEVSGDPRYKDRAVEMLEQAINPDMFTVNDVRAMDFLSAWALGHMTGDMDALIERVKRAIPMLLRRGGHPLRRQHFLNELDKRDLIDDEQVGTRSGII
ncbi:MAG: hypothetical protein CMJ49_07930 [Planctomycetaceae bacterium]|nr:hypothetical protein [Planctomycetaceae bacterium]